MTPIIRRRARSVAPGRVRVVVVLAAVLVGTLCGCGADDAGADPSREQVMAPTGTPGPTDTPAEAPRDSRTVTAGGFVLSADSAYVRSDRTSANGEPMVVLERPSQSPQLPIRVAVLREQKPRADVVEQSYALEVTKRTASKATNITRTLVTWPGAQQAVLMRWTQDVPVGSGGSVSTRYTQLNLQVDADLILIVVGFAPAAEYDGSGVDDIVRTFRPA